MERVNAIFSGIKSFFKRKDKPKPNIKMINEVNEVPNLNASTKKRYTKNRNGVRHMPVGRGISVIRQADRCNKTWLIQ